MNFVSSKKKSSKGEIKIHRGPRYLEQVERFVCFVPLSMTAKQMISREKGAGVGEKRRKFCGARKKTASTPICSDLCERAGRRLQHNKLSSSLKAARTVRNGKHLHGIFIKNAPMVNESTCYIRNKIDKGAKAPGPD